ncbi:hypothetical protein KI387_029831, partial [Taxus chinensis]
IFDWVHRKFRQNNGQTQSANKAEEEGRAYAEAEERARVASDITGLLAIGTFGVQAVAEECEEFVKAVERVDSEITAGEVEMLYEHLDKTLSLIKNDSNNVYPLHHFFHSPLVPRTNNKKESRTSLGDLFSNQESKPIPKEDRQNPKLDAHASKPCTLSFVKKLLKRNKSVQGLQTVSKLDKVLRVLMFHKRIHPEETGGNCKTRRRKEKKNFSCIQLLPCTSDYTKEEPDDAIVTGHIRGLDPYCTQEHWIKTDAD